MQDLEFPPIPLSTTFLSFPLLSCPFFLFPALYCLGGRTNKRRTEERTNGTQLCILGFLYYTDTLIFPFKVGGNPDVAVGHVAERHNYLETLFFDQIENKVQHARPSREFRLDYRRRHWTNVKKNLKPNNLLYYSIFYGSKSLWLCRVFKPPRCKRFIYFCP